MKLLFVIDSLGSGGAQRLLVDIVNGLSVTHEVSIFLYNANSNFFHDRLSRVVTVHRLERRGRSGFSLSVLRQLIQLTEDIDVVVSFLPTANIYCAISGIVSRKARHVACEMSVVNEAESRVRRFIANCANFLSGHVVCNSFTQANYIRGLTGMVNRVSTIWNGCADRPFIPRFRRDARSFMMLVIGRVAYPKNGVRLLQALQIFFDRNGYLPLIRWAGRDDTDERSRMMKQQMLEFLEHHPQVDEKFHFVGEISAVDELYANADALIVPSIYEGVPVVICEAMFSGCPVIATKVSDNEMVLGSNEERGFLCNPLSPEDICRALERRCFQSSVALDQMTRDARQFAEDNFSVARMVNGYLRVINNVTRKF